MKRITGPLLALMLCLASIVMPSSGQQKGKPAQQGIGAPHAAAGPHSVALSWTQAVVGPGNCPSGSGSTAITSNSVYRGTTSGGEGTTPYATIPNPAITFTDSTVTPGATYFYQVTATNCGGESGRSTEVNATIPNPVGPPNAPTGLTATPQ